MNKINIHMLSMKALQSFHIAAKEGSFTRAAEVLNIGQSAVSHGVRQLEDKLGVKLFDRKPQGVVLTTEGERLAKYMQRGFGEIQTGLEQILLDRQREQKVTLSVSTSLASHWLMPRIARFKQEYPDVQLRVITHDNDYDLEKQDFDLCIPLGQVPWKGFRRWKFASEVLFPVCSPDFLQHRAPVEKPEDLKAFPLIHLEEHYAPRFDWQQYFHHYRLPVSDFREDATYSDYSIVVLAAIEGQGVAMGWKHIVQPLIDQGRLVQPIALQIETAHDFHIIAHESKPIRKSCRVLLKWLLSEMSLSHGD